MIRGFFRVDGSRKRPFVRALVYFPSLRGSLTVDLLADTGADRSILAPGDFSRLQADFMRLPAGQPSQGIGGRVETRSLEAILALGIYSTLLDLLILRPAVGRADASSIPSILGRDILSRFALIIEERTDRVLLLEPHEADALNLPR